MQVLSAFRHRAIILWVMGGFIFGIFVALVLIISGWFTRTQASRSQEATPVLTIIRAPTETLTPEPTLTPDAPPASPTTTPGTLSPGVIRLDQLVEIFGTGGDNLRLRAQPGLDATIEFLGVESEVFEVLDGPIESDGYTWWLVRNPYNTEKSGWVVSAFLRPISSP